MGVNCQDDHCSSSTDSDCKETCQSCCADQTGADKECDSADFSSHDTAYSFDSEVALGGHNKKDCVVNCQDDHCSSSTDSDCKETCQSCCADQTGADKECDSADFSSHDTAYSLDSEVALGGHNKKDCVVNCQDDHCSSSTDSDCKETCQSCC